MQTIIITGANGQLGSELSKIMTTRISELGTVSDFYKDLEILPVDIDTLDITNEKAVMDFVKEKNAYAVINCAAMTNVDACEEQRDMALKVNALGPRNLARACEANGSKLVQVSTDYVFSGDGKVPYTEYDVPNPQSVYGASKLLGEQYVRQFCSKWFVVRTSWLYGYIGNNFVKTIAKAAKKNGQLKVVSDQVGNPTNAADLAFAISKMILTDEYGIYHGTGKGECSWYDFACEIVKVFSIDAKVEPCTTEEFPRPAKRPAYSSMDNCMLRNTVSDEFREWKEALLVYSKTVNLED